MHFQVTEMMTRMDQVFRVISTKQSPAVSVPEEKKADNDSMTSTVSWMKTTRRMKWRFNSLMR
jgi:hypothetical protein